MSAEELIARLEARTVKTLPRDWKKGRECPNDGCGGSAERPKCMWDLGSMCPRHDPGNYDPSPYIVKPDPDCTTAAAMLRRLLRWIEHERKPDDDRDGTEYEGAYQEAVNDVEAVLEGFDPFPEGD